MAEDDLSAPARADPAGSIPILWMVPGAAALALVTASRVYLSLALKNVAEPFSEILLGEALKWGLWLAMAPLILAVDRRWGVGAGSWPGAAAVHVPLAAITLAVHTSIMTIAGQSAGWYFAMETAQATALIRLVHEGTTGLLVYIAIIGVDYLHRHRAERERTRLAASRLEAQLATERLRNLQGQLHPHFLFNALHAVAGVIREGEREQAVQTVTRLGDLLRMALRQADRQRVPLSEELDFLEAYLEIQRARYGTRLEVEWRVEPGLGGALVPHLVLQPLVENAVRHGVERALAEEAGGPGRIEITIGSAGRQLVLEVVDNGPGPLPRPEREDDAGVGLSTTTARLEALYGDDFSLEIGPSDRGGTRARIRIPLSDPRG